MPPPRGRSVTYVFGIRCYLCFRKDTPLNSQLLRGGNDSLYRTGKGAIYAAPFATLNGTARRPRRTHHLYVLPRILFELNAVTVNGEVSQFPVRQSRILASASREHPHVRDVCLHCIDRREDVFAYALNGARTHPPPQSVGDPHARGGTAVAHPFRDGSNFLMNQTRRDEVALLVTLQQDRHGDRGNPAI